MKLYFDATAKHFDYVISGETINDIDLSPVPADTKIHPLPQQLRDAGIRAVRRDDQGELHVTLQQAVMGYEYPVPSSDWAANSVPIDSTEYDPNECYVIPTAVADKHDYELVFRDQWVPLPNGSEQRQVGWTVVKVQEGK